MPEYWVITDDGGLGGPFANLAEAEECAGSRMEFILPDCSQSDTVDVVEVVRRYKVREFFHPDGSPGRSFSEVAGPTEADALRAELAECKEWLARFSRDSEAYQLGVEAERRRVLGLIGGRLNDTASEDVVEFALRAGGAMSSQTAAYEKGRRNVLLTIREDLAGNREAVGGEE